MVNWSKNSLHELEIQGYTAEGMGVARLDGRVVFVPHTIRGERWQVRLEKVNKTVAWGKGIQLLTPSPSRLSSDCLLAGRCGGCQFRHMSYEEELYAKRQRVSDALERVGGIKLDLPAVLGADIPQRYRNKVQFPVSQEKNGLAIGYFRPRSHSVLDAEDCLLQPELVTQIRKSFQQWMLTYHIPAYNETSRSGLVRHLYVRTNHSGQALCCIVINGRSLPHSEQLIDLLCLTAPFLVGIVLNYNERDTNVILGDDYHTLWGQDWLEEQLCGLTFRLSVPSFFQINRDQTEKLYAKALEFAQLTGTETVLDLYCGIGTISLALAKQAGHVIGAEIVPQAIEDAKENAARNGVENAEFFCGDAGAIAQRLAQDGIRPDVICVDPPRKGLAPDVPATLAQMAPRRIVYVSCDPATLARDIKRLEELGYRTEKAQAVDLFPRTAHVETVILLSRKDVYERIKFDVNVEDLQSRASSTATYSEIKAYILEKYGLKVSSLYIAQIKDKCGFEKRDNYNIGEGKSKELICPPEKEQAIMDAFRHFGMLRD